MTEFVDVRPRCLTCDHVVGAHYGLRQGQGPAATQPCQVMACSCLQLQLQVVPITTPREEIVNVGDPEPAAEVLRRLASMVLDADRTAASQERIRALEVAGRATPRERTKKFRSRPLVDALCEVLAAIELVASEFDRDGLKGDGTENDILERYRELREVMGVASWARPTSAERWKLALRHELASKLMN